MTDRELLGLAAKAAGLENEPCPNGWEETYPLGWNPLEDDGDAFRLAVSLKISFDTWKKYDKLYAWADCDQREGWETKVLVEGDVYAAVRRSIVEVATMIGKEMP